jgi:hypothetical protein
MSQSRIFVHIPSYRDRECQWTVKDMFEKARHPERVFVGICWQTVPEEDADCFLVETRPEQVRAAHFHISEARGLGWARQHATRFWQGEEYSLQIDSHMRFVPDWDEKMLAMLAACDSPDPVLTGYPPGYTPPDQLQERPRPHVQGVKGFHSNGILEFSMLAAPEGMDITRPMPTAACSGGFIFGSSRILRDVPFDSDIYFNGEEPSLAVRLWTHGFDLFSPHETVIYHYYKRLDGSRHWNDFNKDYMKLFKRTQRRMKALCEPNACLPEEVAALGPYGLGTRRSLAEYEAFSGINYTGKTLAAFTRSFPGVRLGAQWLDSAPTGDWKPAEGLHLFILGDEGVLFSEANGEFYRLTPAATFVWCCLEEGMGWPAIGDALAAWRGIPAEQAGRELAEVAAHWLGQGVLKIAEEAAPSKAEAPEQPEATPKVKVPPPRLDPGRFDFRTHHYRLLGVPFQVSYGDAELEAWLHPVLAHLEVEAVEAPVHTLTLARILKFFYLFCGDTLTFTGKEIAALSPHLKYALLDLAVRAQNHILHLHSGAVAYRDQLILLPAASGSGKTTLTLRLLAAGCEYFTDEAVLIERGTGWVRPAPLSLCVKDSGVDLAARYFPGVAALRQHDRMDGKKVRYLPPPVECLPNNDDPRPASIVVFPRYVEDAPVTLSQLTPAEAFGRLLEECVAIPKDLTLEDAATLVNTMEGLRCYALISGDLDAAAEAVLSLCRA